MVANPLPVNSLYITPGFKLVSIGLHINLEKKASVTVFTAEETQAQRIRVTCLGWDSRKVPFSL